MHMKLDLKIKPKNPIVIEGFPGFGLVGTITTEFLLEHLKTVHIGHIFFEEMPATIAIHNNKVIDPISVNYSKKHNIVIIHAITSPTGIEWKMADTILKICKQLGAKQLITLEGVGAPGAGGAGAGAAPEALQQPTANSRQVFYYTNNDKLRSQLDKAKVNPLGEGIIVGVTSSLLLKTQMPTIALFAETAMGLPDSKAAANIIKVLDKLLGLDIDPKPLIKQAEQFETKLKGLLEQAQQMSKEQQKKQVGYIG